MADHLLTGQHVVIHVECGNGRCRKWWDQPGVDPTDPGWLVCPHCEFSAPANVEPNYAAVLAREVDDPQAGEG